MRRLIMRQRIQQVGWFQILPIADDENAVAHNFLGHS